MDSSDQGVIEGFEGVRLTPLKHSFAVIRGTHPKNKVFTDAYCLSLAGSTAAPDSLAAIASKYLKDPLVKSMVERARTRQGKRFELHGDELIADAVELKNMAMGREPMYQSVQAVDDNGEPVGDIKMVATYGVDLKAAKSTVEMLMRHKGMLKDKKELSGPDGQALMVEPRRVTFVAAAEVDDE